MTVNCERAPNAVNPEVLGEPALAHSDRLG
jgi:hypothetical protein